jgi:hypothetical protein
MLALVNSTTGIDGDAPVVYRVLKLRVEPICRGTNHEVRSRQLAVKLETLKSNLGKPALYA